MSLLDAFEDPIDRQAAERLNRAIGRWTATPPRPDDDAFAVIGRVEVGDRRIRVEAHVTTGIYLATRLKLPRRLQLNLEGRRRAVEVSDEDDLDDEELGHRARRAPVSAHLAIPYLDQPQQLARAELIAFLPKGLLDELDALASCCDLSVDLAEARLRLDVHDVDAGVGGEELVGAFVHLLVRLAAALEAAWP